MDASCPASEVSFTGRHGPGGGSLLYRHPCEIAAPFRRDPDRCVTVAGTRQSHPTKSLRDFVGGPDLIRSA